MDAVLGKKFERIMLLDTFYHESAVILSVNEILAAWQAGRRQMN